MVLLTSKNLTFPLVISLFSHQNAVNMAKALLKTGDLDACTDLTNDEDPICIMEGIMYEIINNQNLQIQQMAGVLETLGLPATDDCELEMGSNQMEEGSRALQGLAAGATGALFGAAAHLI